MKKLLLMIESVILCVCLVFSCTVLPVGAVETVEELYVVYNGTAKANELIGFMVIKDGGNYDKPAESDIYNTEIVKADENGNYSYLVRLKNAELDSYGNIKNYMLKSGIKGLDINSGSIMTDYFITIDGNQVEFTNPPIKKNDVLYMPIEETFSKLGVKLSYNSSADKYTGKGNNGDIEIVMGKNTIEVDWVDIELPAPTEKINGVDMIPLSVIGDAVKTAEPLYEDATRKISLYMPGESTVFDIEKVIAALPQGTELVTSLNFAMGISNGLGSEYLTITKGLNEVTLTTKSNGYGEIPDGNEAIMWCNKEKYDFTKGQTGLISFDAKVKSVEDNSESVFINLMYQRTTDWQKAANTRFEVLNNGEWNRIYIPVYSATNDMTSANGAHFMFRLGGKQMKIGIKNFSFVNYGTAVPIAQLNPPEEESYKGIEDDALWRKEAYKRIEKYRKNDMTVKVVDQNGSPVSNAQISADMTDNEFMFGVSLCNNEVLDLDLTTKRGQTLNKLLDNSFNAGVCGMEMKHGYTDLDDCTDGIKMVNEFLDRGYRIRGHAMLWEGISGTANIEDQSTATYDEWYNAILQEVREKAYTFKGRISQWDVLNEPTSSKFLSTQFDTRGIQADIFKEVHKIDPDAKLYVNETGIEGMNSKTDVTGYLPSLLSIVKELKRNGAPVDGIGIQAHCGNLCYPQGFYHTLEACAELVDEVAVTEYDLLTPKEEYADEYLRDMLLVTFSHPKASAFMVWGVEDSMHWRNAAPFYDRDWNERPAMAVWNKKEEFATHEAALTGSAGTAVIRGFRGDYDIKCKVGNKEYTVPFKLTSGDLNEIVFTVGASGISAQVTNSPDETADKIEYKNSIEAMKSYNDENDAYYDVEFFSRRFKNSIETNTVLDGGNLNTADYTGGKVWGSASGLRGHIAQNTAAGVYITSNSGSADLSHKINFANRPLNTNLCSSFKFDTLDGLTSGTVEMALGLDGSTGNYGIGTIGCSDGEYYLKANDGNKIVLEKNFEYDLTTTVAYSESGSTIRYELLDARGNKLDEYADTSLANADPTYLNELKINLSSSASGEDKVFCIHNVGVRAKYDGEILSFDSATTAATVLRENMRDFSIADTVYMGANPSGSAATLAENDGWGLYASSNSTDAFSYANYGHTLWAVRHGRNGKNLLARRFKPIKSGASVTLEFDLDIERPYQWFDAYGYAGLALGTSDNAEVLPIVTYRYTAYDWYDGNAFSLELLNNTKTVNTVYHDDSWTVAALHASLKFTPNSSGNYDAELRLTRDVKYRELDETVTLENALTAEQMQSLSTLYISNETEGEVTKTRYGEKILGFKNLVLDRTADAVYRQDDGVHCGADAYSFAVKYNNATGKAKDVNLIYALYKANQIVSCGVVPYTLKSGKDSIVFMTDMPSDIDCMKVYLWESMDELVPIKDADILLID